MRLGIMQPYFFPYLGYFDLIASTDRWVVFDTAQYIRHGWVNRNRILHPTHGWQYVGVPVRGHSSRAPIKEVEIAEGGGWRERLLGQLMHYRREAPHFRAALALVEECLLGEEISLGRLNVRILATLCRRLEIPFEYAVFSEMGLRLEAVEGPGDWALKIAAALGADEYVNPPGGAGLFDAARFAARGVRLTIRSFRNMEYACGSRPFEPALSIIDVLMWNSAAAVGRYLGEWEAAR
ncbi:MAG TPA: WbqC family protein [Candidatus Polarisedimenticolia bacterium]|nr:WbqC family protein [Candidatus Polarisedimenticolia bacterium]